MMDPLTHIAFDQYVILTLPSEKCKIVHLKSDISVSLGKFGAFNVNEIIGYPLGTKFEICYDDENSEHKEVEHDKAEKGIKKNTNIMNKISVGKVRLYDTAERENELSNVASSDNNRELINLGTDIQKLSSEEIENLKKKSVSGNEIISRIIESHGSFDKKTIFSQEKYLKRKKQKFEKQFTVDYLSSSLLLQFLIDKNDTQRIMDMSEESIGMLLNLGNIRPNGTYLCMDETGGLLVYFMMERMFGGDNNTEAKGKIIVVHENEHPNIDLLKFSNYSEQFIKDHILTISLMDYFEPPTMEEIEEQFKPLSKESVFELKGGQKNTYYRKLKWYKAQVQTLDMANNYEYDGLIVASTLHLPSLIPRLSEKVHGSRPIVCFSQFKETLLELSHTLYDDLRFLAPSILETKYRPYQSIRGRIHPVMTMRGGGGFLMWCHKVIPAPEPEMVEDEDEEEEEETEEVADTEEIVDVKRHKVE